MPENGNNLQKDLLSALIDNELEELEMLKASHEISRNPDLRDMLVRYQLISDSLRGESVQLSSMKLVNSVSARLESEPTVLAPKKASARLPRWVQPVAGTALAASVAAVGILLGPQLINGGSRQLAPADMGRQIVAQPIGDVKPEPVMVSQAENHWKTIDDKTTRKRLDRYLEQHSQYAVAPGGVQGVMPYTSYVSYGQPSK
ncbi:sigma-E factor negative regulatory protein [Thiolapillus sp.]